jgi:hypothetical protein
LVADCGQLEVEGLAAHEHGAAVADELKVSLVFAAAEPLLGPGHVAVWSG